MWEKETEGCGKKLEGGWGGHKLASMTGIKEDQPCFTPQKDSVSLKHTSVSVICISFKPIEVTILKFAHHLIQCNHTHNMDH